MEYVILDDTSIIAVNLGRHDNESSNIVYRDKKTSYISLTLILVPRISRKNTTAHPVIA